jgi:hypothetical protein
MANSSIFAFCLAAGAIWLTAIGRALAQPPTPASSGGGGGGMDYVLSYMVVFLAIILGLLVVARSSSRRDRERPAGYVEKKIAEDE